MSKEQQKQMLELRYQMEKLQSEMEDVEQKEKRTKKYERKASLKQKPNLDFMEEWLENSAILKDYYESEDQANHWYKINSIMKHPDVKDFFDKSNINLNRISTGELYSNLEYIKLVDNIIKKMSEMKEFFQPKENNHYYRHPQQVNFYSMNSFSWSKISENQYPGPSQIKFVQNVNLSLIHI